MSAKLIKPAGQLLKMWKTITTVVFMILLLVPLLMFGIGAPLEIGIIALSVWFVLWITLALYLPAFYRSLAFSIEPDAILLHKGVFWKRRTTVPYAKITNIDITQGPVERHYKLSKLHIQTAGSNAANNAVAELLMCGITDPEALKDMIMSRIHKPASVEPAPLPVEAGSNELLHEILTEIRMMRES
ncbi:MAG: PH domain-containing protein, partial [Candidatus Cloacimonadaceae bacterium]|nr:PH domain-containing protein [Candidatus Cloacimonadaceae bacterium]